MAAGHITPHPVNTPFSEAFKKRPNKRVNRHTHKTNDQSRPLWLDTASTWSNHIEPRCQNEQMAMGQNRPNWYLLRDDKATLL